MLRSAVGKVMWVGRATVFLVGLAVILAVIFGVATAALAGNGDAWRLGRGNVATKITGLGGAAGVDGAMLRLTNNNGGTGDTALDLQVQPGEPPMTIDSSTRVSSLNADYLDSMNAADFVRNSTYRAGQGQERAGTLLTDGTRVMAQSCGTGDRLLSGGPASVDPGSKVLDSFPIDVNTWQARILPASGGDNWTIAVLCADQ